MKKTAAAICATLLLCFGGLELGLRALGRGPTNMADGIAAQYGDSFRLKKNITKIVKYPAFTYTVRTNAYGFRDASTGPRDLGAKPFCVFLGASDVFGNGVDYEDSFVGIFAAAAAARGLDVLNLAVGGHYFLDQEDLFKDFMAETGLKPRTVFLCVNALHIPKFDRRNRHVVVKSGYVMARRAWPVTYVRLLAGNISSAFCFFRDGIRSIQQRYFRYEVTEKSPEFLQIYDKTNPIRQPARIRQFEDYLDGFEAFCREKGIELAYVYLPLSDSFNLPKMLEQLGMDPDLFDASFYEGLIREHCRRAGARFISPRTALERCLTEGRELRFKLDPHFNPFANKVIGDHLVAELFPDP
jgi:hypothetical protein